jgi:hypothetical protein
LHPWEFPVISQLRTNFAEMPGNRIHPGAAGKIFKGDAVVRVGRVTTPGGENRAVRGPRKEEAIEIGNCHSYH